MTIEQFSNEFDVMLNAQDRQPPAQLDEYEKSVFLSEAQEEIVRKTYRGQNFLRESFEETELMRRYLDKLIKQQTVTQTVNLPSSEKINTRSLFFALPNDVMVITYEAAKISTPNTSNCNNNKILSVLPVKQDEYLNQISNPFRKPTLQGRTNTVWRLDYGNSQQRVVELVGPLESTVSEYIVRYLRKPKPIILTLLNGDLNIDGEVLPRTSELDEIFHRQILELAVEKSLQSKRQIQRNQAQDE
jgi:hypothetical protein